jgi:hypothetical protein
MNPQDSERFKADYHKFADRQVDDRTEGEAMARLRLSLFVAALGPASLILIKVLKYSASPLIRTFIIGTIPVSLILLAINFARLPAKTKGSVPAITVLLMTLVAAGVTYPLFRALLTATP